MVWSAQVLIRSFALNVRDSEIAALRGNNYQEREVGESRRPEIVNVTACSYHPNGTWCVPLLLVVPPVIST
jgi:hypothetical protein